MKTFLLSIAVLLSLNLSGQDDKAKAVFDRYKTLRLDNKTMLYADFVARDNTNNIPDTKINLVTYDVLSLESDDLDLRPIVAGNTYEKVFVFADLITVDRQRDLTDTYSGDNLGGLQIGAGKYKADPVQNFATSAKPYAGKVELTWDVYPDAEGYIILRDLPEVNGHSVFTAVQVINSGLTTSWSDFDVSLTDGLTSYNYYILAFNLSKDQDRFLTMASAVETRTTGMEFQAIGGNEELTTLIWEYDNSILQGRELEAINETVIGNNYGEVFNERLYISDFNIGNARLQFNGVQLNNRSGTSGVYMTTPVIPDNEASTIEFWMNPGDLVTDPQIILSNNSENHVVGISRNGLLIFTGDHRGVKQINHSFKSNTWTHVAFTSDGLTITVVIDGSEAGTYNTPGADMLYRFGVPDVDLAGYINAPPFQTYGDEPYWTVGNPIIGTVRTWSVARTSGQIRQDMYDEYTESSVDNLTNQWTIPNPLDITNLPGLTNNGLLNILTTATYDEGVESTQAYIFDRSDITRIRKLKSVHFSDVFNYKNYEVGSGKFLLEDNANSNDNQTRPIPPNKLNLAYDFDPNKNINDPVGDLGTIDIEFITGSTFPKYYSVYRESYAQDREDTTFLTRLDPRKVENAFKLPSASANSASTIDLPLEVALTSERTYSFLIRLSNREYPQTLFSLDDLGLSINAVGELQMHFSNGDNPGESHRFISSIKEPRWMEVDLVVKPVDDKTEVYPYLNGQQLDTVFLSNSAQLFNDKIVIGEIADRQFDIGYIAHINRALTKEEILVKYNMVPDIKDGWTLYYSNGDDKELHTSRLDGSIADPASIKDSKITLNELVAIPKSESRLDFVNYGNMLSVLHYTDSFGPSNVIQSTDTFQYVVKPFYEETFLDTVKVFNKRQGIKIPDLKLSSEYQADDRAIKLNWDQEYLEKLGYDSVRVYREGKALGVSYKFGTYIDPTIATGATYKYSISPIKNGVGRLIQTISSEVEADGAFSGHLISLIEDIIVPETDFQLSTEGQILSIRSSGMGYFERSEISYGLSSTFSQRRAENGSITLTKTQPVSGHNFLKTEKNYVFERVSNLIEADSIEVDSLGENLRFKIARTEEAKDLLASQDFFINVYINDELQRILTNDTVYIDSLAHGEINDFTFKMYYLSGEKKVVIDKYDYGQVENPAYYPISSLQVIPDAQAYINTIAWEYPATNKINGFNVYRLSEDTQDTIWLDGLNYDKGLMDDVTGTKAYTIIDSRAVPGKSYYYDIAPYYVADSLVEIESIRKQSELSQYPLWIDPNINVSIDESTNQITVTDPNWEKKAIDGFILRDGEKIINIVSKKDFKERSSDSFIYDWLYHIYTKDSYDVNLSLFKHTNDHDVQVHEKLEVASESVSNNDGYDFEIKEEGYEYLTKLFVKLNIINQGENTPEYFRVNYNGVDTLLDHTTKTFAYNPTKFGNTSQSVTIHAGYRGVEKKIYNKNFSFEDNLNIDGIAEPSEFIASKEGINKIALSWEYPKFGLARFVIYRDGAALDTLATHRRSYFDDETSLKNGHHYTYQIKAIYGDSEGKYHTAVGMKKARSILNGIVYDALARPVPFAKVEITPEKQYQQVGGELASPTFTYWTDSLGVYWVDNIDLIYGDKVNISVTVPEVESGDEFNDSRDVTIQRSGQIRNDFKFDHLYNIYESENGPAEIRALKAYSNVFNHTITLRWAISSTEVSYFEIYNQIGAPIGRVDRNDAFEFIHEDAVPGRSYTYLVQPVYVDINGIESRPLTNNSSITHALPEISPVELLSATIVENEGRIQIDWIHDLNNVDGYTIERLGFTMDEIENSDELDASTIGFSDDTGVPDQSYSYTILPYVKVDGEEPYTALSRSTGLVEFPSVPPVKDVELKQDLNAYAIDLSWKYEETNGSILGVEVRREDDLIATVNYPDTIYKDVDGFPNTKTVYSLTTLVKLEEAEPDIFRSKPISDTIWYPTVRPVLLEDISLDESRSDSLIVTWDYQGKGVDYFVFTYDQQGGGSGNPEIDFDIHIPASTDQNTYEYIIKDFQPETVVEMTLRAVKSINDQVYPSDLTEFDGQLSALPGIGDYEVRKLTNSYYYVSWEYPSFNFKEFVTEIDGFRHKRYDQGRRAIYYPIPLSKINEPSYAPRFTLDLEKENEDGIYSVELFDNPSTEAYTVQGFYGKINASEENLDAVRITWTAPQSVANGTSINNWEIYRTFFDPRTETTVSELSGDVQFAQGETSYEYFDYGAKPGLAYVYQIVGVSNPNTTAPAQFDYLPDVGSIPGKASVLVSIVSEKAGFPIENIPFTLIGKTLDNVVYQTGFSNESGHIEFMNLPYENKLGELIQYEIVPNIPQEHYSWDFQGTLTFDNASQRKILAPVRYKKTFDVLGRTKYANCGKCGIEGVKVYIDVYSNADYSQASLILTEEATSDSNGDFSLSVPPIVPYFFQLRIDQTSIENQTDGTTQASAPTQVFYEDTLRFTGRNFDEQGIFRAIFEDETIMPLNLRIADACGDNLGDYQFKIHVSDLEDNQYDSTFYTNNLGELYLDVPPYNLRASVVGVTNPDAFATTVIDYFRSRSNYYDLKAELDFYIDELPAEDYPREFAYAVNHKARQMTFQRTPEIVTSDFNPQCTGSDYLILDGDAKEFHTVNFRVLDDGCDLKEGYIIIKNPGASQYISTVSAATRIELDKFDPDAAIAFDESSGLFEYTFVAEHPNMAQPYTHLVEVYYLDPSFNVITSNTYEYVVTGSKFVEGNDVFVDPAGEEGSSIVNVPAYVLRDPPGDHSYSYLEKGSEFTISMKTSTAFESETAFGINNDFEGFAVFNSSTKWSTKVGESSSATNTVKFKVNERISTAEKSVLSTNLEGYLDGKDADVVVGAGFAYKYGIQDVLSSNPATCELEKTQIYTVEPDGISTVWHYSRSMIEQTIKYYEGLIANNSAPDAATNQLVSSDMNGLPGGFTDWESFLGNSIDNWRRVLRHVDYTTNPLCQLRATYDEFTYGGIDDFGNELEERLDAVFGSDSDETISDVIVMADQLILDMQAFQQVYDNELLVADPDACLSEDPFQSIFDLPSTSGNEFMRIYSKAYDASLKLNILSDYAFNQLTEVYAASKVNLENEVLIDENGVVTDLGGDPNALFAASTSSSVARGIDLTKQIDRGYRFLTGHVQAVREANKIASTAEEVAQQARIAADNSFNALTAQQKEFANLYRKAGGQGGPMTRAQFNSLSIKDAKRYNSLYHNMTEGQRLVVRDAVNFDLRATEGAQNAARKRTFANNLSSIKSKIPTTRADLWKKLPTRSTVLKGLGKFGVVAGISIGADILLRRQFTITSEKLYDELRNTYEADLLNIANLAERDISETIGYNGSENIDIGLGSGKISREYRQSEIDQNAILGSYGTSIKTDMEIGLGSGFALWFGLGAGSKVDNLKFKLTFTGDFNQRVEQNIASITTEDINNTSGFVLSDDDDGDIFNLFVVNTLSGANSLISPYFHLVGGKSSDPYEEGTIPRDLPTVSLEDEEGNKYSSIFFNQDPNLPVKIPLKITSGNRFEEGRSVALTLIPNSNASGAQFLLNNAEIYTGREVGFFIPKDQEAVYTNLFISKTGGVSDYPDLGLVVRPFGLKSDFFTDGEAVFDSVSFHVRFRQDPPAVLISDQDGPWNIRSTSKDREKENYIFILNGYDAERRVSDLKYIEMQYKRAGSSQFDWQKMDRIRIDDEGQSYRTDTIGVQELADFYTKNNRIYNEPTFPFEWDITNEDLLDGEYLVRAVAYDDNGFFSTSSTYSGIIDRKGPSILQEPSPQDGVYSVEDAINVQFDEAIDREYFLERGSVKMDIFAINSDSIIASFVKDAPDQLDFNVTSGGSDVNIEVGLIPYYYDGHRAKVSVAGVYDYYGNGVEMDGDTISWEFKLDYYKKDPSAVYIEQQENWLFNLSNLADTVNGDTLRFTVSGYDVYEKFSSLSRIDLQVRELDRGEWTTVSSRTQFELVEEFEQLNNPESVPGTEMIWTVNDSSFVFNDGNYEVRALAFSSEGQYNESNTTKGKIDRVAPKVVGLANPSDGILSRGEIVSFNFSENIDYTSDEIIITILQNTDTIDISDYVVDITPSIISVTFDESFILDFSPADTFNVKVLGVKDLAENPAGEIEVSFVMDYFSIPASPISIVNTDNWLINGFSSAQMPITIADYNLYGSQTLLDSITLEYRKTQYQSKNDGGWHEIITLEKADLKSRFEVHGNPGEIPVDTISWYNYLVPDGNYEVRAVAYGGRGFTVSNTVSGIIDRTSPSIFGPPSPIDELLSFSDKAGITFTEKINYAISGSDVLSQNTKVYSSSDTLGYSDYTISVSGNSIEMYIDGQYISEHNGDTLFVTIAGIEDVYGNPLYEEIDWSFRLQQQDLKPVVADITSPTDYIVNVENKEEDIQFTIENFDPNEFYSQLDTIYLEYKMVSENSWRVADQLSKSTLLANYELLNEGDEEFTTPTDTLVMKLSELNIPDGTYQFRTATLGGDTFAYSSAISVTVDRVVPSVQDFTPSDQIFGRGDDIGVSFNEDIDVTAGITFDVQGLNGSEYFEMITSKGGLIFEPKAKFEDEIASLDGEILAFTINGVKDLAGNAMEPYQWSFTVDFFRIPPSPVSIKSPARITVTNNPATQEVPITLDGFELNNTGFELDRIELERLVAGTENWHSFYVFTRNELEQQNAGENVLEAEFFWKIGNSIAEGNHQLRAVSYGGGQFDYSNIIDITIDRIAPQLVQFDPADQVYSNGDNIGFEFNESLLSTQLVEIDILDSELSSVKNAFTSSQTSSGIVIQPKVSLAAFDGDELTISLNGIFDEVGNELIGGVSRSFLVDYFSKPPSPVTLVADDFIINGETEGFISVIAKDYDLYEFLYSLDTLVLQIRNISENEPWNSILYKGLEELKSEHSDPEKEPSTIFQIPTDIFTEGKYSVRIVSHGNEQFEYSNTVSGLVDKVRPRIVFEPQDGFYSQNDFLGFSSNEELNITDGISVKVRTAENENISGLFNRIVTSSGVELLPKVYSSLALYDGETLKLVITSDIEDLVGNPMRGSKIFDFEVDYHMNDISPLNVIDPVGDVVINSESVATTTFTVQGYELGNDFFLDRIELLIQKPTDLGNWYIVDTKSKEDLAVLEADQHQLNWTILESDPEGEYLAQVRVYGNDQFNIASDHKILVDRVAPFLINASPVDGIYGRGGEIVFNFSEDLNLDDQVDVTIKDDLGNTLSNDLFIPVISGSSIILQEGTDLVSFDGERLTIELSNVKDIYGNSSSDLIEKEIVIDYFTKLPSPVEIKAPSDFIVNAITETIEVVAFKYDVFEIDYSLDSLVLEYRQILDPDTWISVEAVDIDYLKTLNTTFPEVVFNWDVSSLLDGDYEVRMVSFGDGRYNYSSVIGGTIDKLSPQVVGMPSPQDGVLDMADEISVSFNEVISIFNMESDLSVTSSGEIIDVEVVHSSDKINFNLTEQQRFDYLGDSLNLTINKVEDFAGNVLESETSWTFIVNNDRVELSDLQLDNDGWIVSSLNAGSSVPITYSGYSAITHEVDSILIEYRIKTENNWNKVASISREQLLVNLAQVSDVVYLDPSTLEDGEYEVRGVVYGFGGQNVVRSTISGVIDREAPQLLSAEPSDSSYMFGDEISFNFDESIDCSQFSFQALIIDQGKVEIFNDLVPVCDSGGSLIFGPNNQALFDKAGKTVKIELNGIKDQYWNEIAEELELSFVVGEFFLETSPISLQTESDAFLVNETTTSVPLTLKDYDFTRSKYALDSVGIQLSTTFSGEWRTIWSGSVDDLIERYNERTEEFFDLNWEPSETLEDGLYSLRGVAYGNGGVPNFSETLLGEVDRYAPDINDIENDEGGKVIVTFNEEISKDPSLFDITLKQMVNGIGSVQSGRVSAKQAALSSYSTISQEYYQIDVNNNLLEINYRNVMMNEFGNEDIEVVIQEVIDGNGNSSQDLVYHHSKVPARFDSLGSNLSGTYDGKGGIDLTWTYFEDIRAESFILERMLDFSFDSIASFDTRKGSFVFKDQFNFEESVYYRLKYEGEVKDTYSKIIKIDIDGSISFEPIANVYPNPTDRRDQLNFKVITQNHEEEIIVKVYNDRGVEITDAVIDSEDILFTVFNLNLKSEISAGTYFIELIQGNSKSIQRVIVK